MICWKCQKEISFESIHRSDECPFCHADLHSCRACEFYEKASHNDCRESSAELVTDKEKSNFCDYFKVKKALLVNSAEKSCSLGLDSESSKIESARNAAAALFGDDSIKKEDGKSAKDAFNALFG
ncbi:MAG: hypothetical protein K5829_12700 [Treponema sp.]|nr:hypothetical protein [Treponema sp.]